MKMFILRERIGDSWVYLCGLSYYDSPKCDWILGDCTSYKRKDAMVMCEAKALRVQQVLNVQSDECGGVSEYELWEVKR